MTSRATGALMAATVMAVSLVACTSADGEDSSLRHAGSVAVLKPEKGVVDGDIVISGSTAVTRSLVDEKDTLTGFNLRTGAETWVVPEVVSNDVWVGSDFFVFQSSDKKLEIRELETGELRRDVTLKSENLSGDRGYLAGVADGVVLVVNPEGDRRQVLAGLDAESGDELWTYKPDDADDFSAVQPVGVEFGTAVEGDGNWYSSLKLASDAPMVTVADSDRRFEAIGLDVETGEKRWTVDTGGAKGIPWMDWSGDGVASAVTGSSEESEEFQLTAVEVESGKREELDVRLAEYNVKLDRWDPLGEEHPGVRVADGFAFVQDDYFRPQVVDLRTGEPVWTAEFSGQPLVCGDSVAVYRSVTSKGAGEVYGVDVDSGEVLWRSEKVEPDVDAVIVDGQLLVRGKDGVEVYDVKTGEPQWRFRGSLLGWNDDYYLFKKTENDKAVKVVARDGE